MDNPFKNLNFTKWYNMIAVASFLVFMLSVSALFGVYELPPHSDIEFIKNTMFYSMGIFCIAVGELSSKHIVPNEEIGQLHQVDPFTGESLGHIPNYTRVNGTKEIRKFTFASFILYGSGIAIIIYRLTLL